ncbi:beta family protein [Sphingopyxis indica]|uniref:beta family protein n=1 Tax=Sphingopyxis indica TaxID=436663 RepID=UPI00293946A2|nr:beta family protein [Sphingopyxis indica]WOF43876.1 beta family protein [Sphingopyxis indica]
MITHLDYVPALKWRQGEYQALLRLSDAQKLRVVPLIEITPPEFDFELWVPKKTIDEHLATFATRLKAKWGPRPALLDCGLVEPAMRMADGTHPLSYLYDRAATLGANLIPVTNFERDADYQRAVCEIDAVGGTGAALRCGIEDMLDPEFDKTLDGLLGEIEINISALDIILDLRSPAFEPQADLVAIVISALSGASAASECRSITLIATSFPDSMGAVTPPLQFWPRREWLLYKAVRAALPAGFRTPGFGDYAIAGAEFAQMDMRVVKPSATIRYAVDDGWLIAKGVNVRDNGFAQCRTLSGSITTSPSYLGISHSAGSAYIDGCRAGTEKTGNLTTWRWVGTNHHIAKVVSDLATLHGP